MDLHRPRRQFDVLAVARQIIGALALDLDRGVFGGDLFDQPGESRQQLPNRFRRGPNVARTDDAALGVGGVGLLAPGDHEAIALAAVHHIRNGLGGLAERDRQAAGGERIERAGMTCASRLEQTLDDRDRLSRRHADRLVEHDPAMDVALVAARLIVLPRWPGLARIVVGVPLLGTLRIRKNIFLRTVLFSSLRADRFVCGGPAHRFLS